MSKDTEVDADIGVIPRNKPGPSSAAEAVDRAVGHEVGVKRTDEQKCADAVICARLNN